MSVAANRYAKALMDVLYPDNAETGFEQLRSFSELLVEEPDAGRILENPTISVDRRKGLLKEIGDAYGFIKPIRRFLDLLVERDRLNLRGEILDAYQKLMDERLGIVRAEVTAARPLDADQQRQLGEKLESVTGKKIRMEVVLDPALIGGVVARVGSTIYDGSLRQQLQSFKNRLSQE
jgi:F-type H+-transporting ATPase subunit delta